MKAKIKVTFGTMFLGLAISAATSFSGENESIHSLLNTDLEVLAASECISTSGKNTGKCEAAVNGSGDVCVQSSWYERNNCVTHMNF